MGKTAEAVLEAVKDKTADASSVVKLFQDAVAKMDKGEAPEGETPTARVVIIDALAEPEQMALPLAAGPTEVAGAALTAALTNDQTVAETPVAPIQAPSVADGTTDDTRAPLELKTKVIEPKAPRKPFINWNAVGDQFKKGWGVFTRGVSLVTVTLIDWLFTAIAGVWFILSKAFPCLCYTVGWVMRGTYNSWMNGWNQVPLFEGKVTDPQPPKTPGALALVA